MLHGILSTRRRKQFDQMKRREFVILLDGAAVWPVGARAQQTGSIRRIGMILPADAQDPEFHIWIGAFLQELALLGWAIGRNVRIETHWATADPREIRKHSRLL